MTEHLTVNWCGREREAPEIRQANQNKAQNFEKTMTSVQFLVSWGGQNRSVGHETFLKLQIEAEFKASHLHF